MTIYEILRDYEMKVISRPQAVTALMENYKLTELGAYAILKSKSSDVKNIELRITKKAWYVFE